MKKEYIDKAVVKAELERIEHETNHEPFTDEVLGKRFVCRSLLSFLNSLEGEDPYEQCVQYDSIKAGIQAHAETYSFNIESELFNQLTKEQQPLWRKEIEQAVISGGDAGVTLARDQRYKENPEVKEVDLEEEMNKWRQKHFEGIGYILDGSGEWLERTSQLDIAKHFYELGLKTHKGE